MYESYWQLKQKPFDHRTDPRYYFPAETHQGALLKLRYAIENGRGGALLAGASGTGKTFVLGMLPPMLGEQFAPFVHLVFPQMSSDELLGYLADELDGGQGSTTGWQIQESVRRIEQFLGNNVEQGRHAVVVVDEAQLLNNAHVLETMRLLLNFQFDGKPGLTLVLAGQTGLLSTLERMPQLDERLWVKCLVRSFTEQETADYVAHRLSVAGATRTIFEPDALSTLYTLTHGVPQQINRLCDLALLIGFAEEQETIGPGHFEAVCRELVAVTPE
jgi:general secretion pathway protein A